jgi:PAS domain S-box-containing protein
MMNQFECSRGRQECHVLVVEDDADTRENLCDILSLDNVIVETAATAAEAMRPRDWGSILAVVLDRKLPDGTAGELLPHIKRLAPHAEVVVVTGYADLDGAIAALRAGATDYILKPVNADALRTCLQRIIARRQSAEALEESEARFRAVFENSVIGIVVCTVASPFLVLENNAVLERMLDCGAGALRGRALTDLIHGDDRGPFSSICNCLSEQAPCQLELRFLRHQGQPLWVEIACSLVRTADGAAGYAIFFVKDISAEKEAQAALTVSENRLRVALKNSAIGVCNQDLDLRYTWVYTPWGQMSAENLLGKRDQDVFEPENAERLTRIKQRVLQTGHPARQEVPLVLGQETHYFDLAVEPQRDAAGNVRGVTSVVIDVTQRKRAQERLLQQERLAAIGQTMTGLVHEGRNALQRSKACLEMLALEVEDRPEALDLVARAQRAQEHLHQLYEEVRQYAAPLHVKRQATDLGDVWRETWANLADSWKVKGLTLRESCAGASLICAVDPFAVGQVFRNIFENAIEVSPHAGEIAIAAQECAAGSSHLLRIAIRDSGPGMTREQRKRVFEPFFTTKVKGTGLGMAICQRIVESHDGRIAVCDRDGPGAEFIITLPKGVD